MHSSSFFLGPKEPGSRLAAPAEAATITIDVGGLGVRLFSQCTQWMSAAKQRFEEFSVAGAVDVAITYEVNDSKPPQPKQLFEARMAGLTCKRHGHCLSLEGAGFTAEFDPHARALRLQGPIAMYPVDLLLPVLWYELRQHGVIVHGAALAKSNDGYLLSGPSGSGKSTLAGLFPEASLCDEFAAISWDDPRDGERQMLFALPFWTGRPGSAELRAIHLLEHGKANVRTVMRPAAAYRALQRETCWPLYDPKRLRKAFDDLAKLIEQVPVWQLAFRPDESVWETIVAREDPKAS